MARVGPQDRLIAKSNDNIYNLYECDDLRRTFAKVIA